MPDATPVVRIALMSRVPVYATLIPVFSSNGLTIARNDSCSEPPQVPMTVTLPLPPAPTDAAGEPLPLGADDAPPPVEPAGDGELPPEHAPKTIAVAASSVPSERRGLDAMCMP